MLGSTSGDDSDISDYDMQDGITSVYTVDEMLSEGLLLAGFSREKQRRQPKSNLQDFVDRYGSTPTVLCKIWIDLQVARTEEARVPPAKRVLKYYLMAHHFLKQYPTESERKAAYQLRTQTMREWVWFFVEKIRALKVDKIVWPASHIHGDDIWVCTIDGTMFASNEIAGEDKAKDPQMFSHKHHGAGFNAEVAVSVKESRCIWINGPGPAGKDVNLVLFCKPGGLREKLLEYGKKGIADGG